MVELSAGTIIEGRYRLARPLAEGGMGVVWAATRLDAGPPVALKLLRPTADASPAVYRRFLREARAAAAVRHPSVVTIHEVLVLDDGTPVIVMDLLQGESLRVKLERERLLQLTDVARILLPVISAVGSAHSLGIIHRDLKPENIFLLAAGNGLPPGSSRVKVLDFGIAKLTAVEGDAARTAGLTDTGTILGTPYYMSPEQVLGSQDVDHRADIWSLGVILYETLTGIRPTEGNSVGKILRRIVSGTVMPIRLVAPHIPRNILDLVDRTLSVDREKRPSLTELGRVLERYGNVTFRPFGPPAPSVPPPPPESHASAPLIIGAEATLAAAGLKNAPTLPDLKALPVEDDVEKAPSIPAPPDLGEPTLFDDLARAPAADASGAPEVGRSSPEAATVLGISRAAVPPPPIAEPEPSPTSAPPSVEPDAARPVASSEPPPPPRARWTTYVGGTLVLVAGTALILLWQRPAAVARMGGGGAAAACPEGMTLGSGSGSGSGSAADLGVEPGLCLDERKVTVEMYRSCVARGQCATPRAAAPDTPGRGRCRINTLDPQDVPMDCVRREEAEAYCRAAGKRLATEADWARAAPGDEPYPWSPDQDEARAGFRCAKALDAAAR